MNKLDLDYQNILKDVLQNGVKKETRNGSTISVFSKEIRHKMSDGFPLLTTKKMPFKTIFIELIWFLKGDTNIKYLVDNGCNIWNGDAYKRFYKEATKIKDAYNNGDLIGTQPHIEWMFSNPDELIILSQEEFINKIKTDDVFAKEWGELGPIYGKQWRSWRGTNGMIGEKDEEGIRIINWEKIDQIKNLINDLKTNPDSRRLMVNAWNVGELEQMVLPPCHYGFQVYTRELSSQERVFISKNYGQEIKVNWDVERGYLHYCCDKYNIPKRAISLKWNQRSVDTFLGLPFNIASYGLLLEIIAKAVNMVPDELIGSLGDVHLYSNHIEQAKEQISRIPYELPKLNINTEFWPTISGSCGEGELDALAIFDSFKYDDFCKCLLEDVQLLDYKSHPIIKAPLSN